MFKIQFIFLMFSILLSTKASALELTDIFNNIAVNKQRSTQFTETKTSFFLSEPLVSKGSLRFVYPSTLYKKITSPIKSSTKITADELSILSPNEPVRTTRLSNYPKLELSINAIRWMLAGNSKALSQNFKVLIDGNNEQWIVELMTKDEELQHEFKYISLSGNDKNIQQFIVKRSNGETITTHLHDE